MFKIWLYSSAALWHKLACKTWYDELPQRSCTSVIASFVSNQTLQWALRCKNTSPSYTLWSTCLLRSMIMFALCFMMGNAHKWGTHSQMQGWTWCLPCLRPFILAMLWPWASTLHFHHFTPSSNTTSSIHFTLPYSQTEYQYYNFNLSLSLTPWLSMVISMDYLFWSFLFLDHSSPLSWVHDYCCNGSIQH
jgi:hypothetical protein